MPVSELPNRRQGMNPAMLLRFVSVGGSTAAIYLGLTFVLVEALHLQTTIASTVACTAAVIYNYLMHYHWTFNSDAPHGKVLRRYVTMCVGGILLNALIMHLGVAWFDVHYMLVQLAAALAVVCWSLCISSLWVFRH